MRNQTQLIICLILCIGVIAMLFYLSRNPVFAINSPILDYGLRTILILGVLFALFYSIKMGTSTTVLKGVFVETAERTGLKLTRPKGTRRLVVPLTAFRVLEGNYKGYNFLITPSTSIVGPLGARMNMLSWGHVDLIIDVLGPFKISYENPRIRKENGSFLVELPEELKGLPYKFNDNSINIREDRLRLLIEYKCPRTADDLIKIIDTLVSVADDICV